VYYRRMSYVPEPGDRMLKPGEVARLFRVHPRAVRRWGHAGKLTRYRTPGGSSLYSEAEVRALLAATEGAGK
jgi:DNA-binding transcriptional MerR regulator